MTLCQPYYIEKRKGEGHVSLDGEWEFCYLDHETEDVSLLDFAYKTKVPLSIYNSLFEAGILPDPYYGTNSKQYHWVDEKVWYYRRRFSLNAPTFQGNAFLCFEGVSYYMRLWVNGVLVGDHEGMFGGPVCDVASLLRLEGENEIVVEVKACNYGKKEGYQILHTQNSVSEIIPWNVARDRFTSNGDFIVVGLWNSVRLELVPTLHLSRPYLYTDSISDGEATLRFETQIADGQVKELAYTWGAGRTSREHSRAFDTGLTGSVKDRSVKVQIKIWDEDGVAYESSEDVPLWDFDALGMDPDYHELQFYRRDIKIKNPKLWYPNGIGEAHLYQVSVSLWQDGKQYDEATFPFGIRTFTAGETAGNKYRARWEKFLFSVNGKEIFLKGMNWTPMDFLYDVSPERYEWCLTMAKNAGIQLLRIWNGGGMQESDTFYALCDKLGLMVWQDLFIANQHSTNAYPHVVLECQTAYNLYRTRNHPSLVLLCGGNEFNPYAYTNAAGMFIMDRNVRTLTPDRIFHYTTSDKGSAHVYVDMEPVWYRTRYRDLPFMGESGIHSLPNFKSIKKLISEREAGGILPDLADPSFAENYPDLLNHFTEYRPDRVPRMMARASQILDMRSITLAELCEATHVQSYEFYQLLIQSMQDHYPRCGGVMPWVFKRPWTTTAIQTVDGNDLPTFAYYAVQNAYRPLNVFWRQPWTVWAPGEEMTFSVGVFNQNGEDLSGALVSLTVYRPDLSVCVSYRKVYEPSLAFDSLTLDEGYTDTCFLVCVDLMKEERVLARSVYFNKCTSVLADPELYRTYRSAPAENLRFENGPWLKPSVQQAKKARLSAQRAATGKTGVYEYVDVAVKNLSDVPAYPVTLDLTDEDKRFFLDENFFLLKPGEEKIIRLTCDSGTCGTVVVSAWNGERLEV